ncbi:MAG: hypothetical protein Fur0037_10880 [Planctomycetota bacterium]
MTSDLSLVFCVPASLLLIGALPAQDSPGRPAAAASTAVAAERSSVTDPLDRAISGALRWLAAHQSEDGRWDSDGFMKHDAEGVPCDGPGNPMHDVAATGLAMLAFLGDGNTLRRGPYRQNLKRAASWLRSIQGEDGLFGETKAHDFIYDHAIASFAICETYGLSGYRVLKRTAQRCLDYLAKHRNPHSVWRYQPRDADNDTSVTTWALLALKSGKDFGLAIDEEAFGAVARWYDSVTSEDGMAGYTKRGERSSRMPGDHARRFPPERGEAMTAAALLGRLALGQDPKDAVLAAAAARILAKPPDWKPEAVDAYYWFMGTAAMTRIGGDGHRKWAAGLLQIVDHQRHDGNAAGSWDPVGVWDGQGGRIYCTALYALCLEYESRMRRLVR